MPTVPEFVAHMKATAPDVKSVEFLEKAQKWMESAGVQELVDSLAENCNVHLTINLSSHNPNSLNDHEPKAHWEFLSNCSTVFSRVT